MKIYPHSQLKFAKYYLVFLLLFFGDLGIAAGYHIVSNIGDYELSGSVDAAALALSELSFDPYYGSAGPGGDRVFQRMVLYQGGYDGGLFLVQNAGRRRI